MKSDTDWNKASKSVLGIDEIRAYIKDKFGVTYAPNTRESIRKDAIDYFRLVGVVLKNQDDINRSTNDKNSSYQVEENALNLIRTYGSNNWDQSLKDYLKKSEGIKEKYAEEIDSIYVSVKYPSGEIIKLAPGKHSNLIKNIVEIFVPNYLHSDNIVFTDDTGKKETESKGKTEALNYLKRELGIELDIHGKMPDVIVHIPEKKWLVLIEAFTSVGPIDVKRHNELKNLFTSPNIGLVYVTAFPNRKTMAKSLSEIDWETEVWVADSPTHLVHFNGEKFLGPYN